MTQWHLIGLIRKNEKFPSKYHAATQDVDGSWVFRCGHQDMVSPTTTIKDLGTGRQTVHGQEACGSCWRVMVSINPHNNYVGLGNDL